MALFLNNTKMTTATTGTGTVTLGSAVSGFLTYALGGAVDQCIYGNRYDDGSAWELSTGTYTASGTTMTRVLVASSTGSLLSLSGSAVVTSVMLASDSTRQLIQEVVTSGSQANVTFSAFPATFRDLEIRIRGRGTNSSTDVQPQLQFNSDTASNYNSQWALSLGTTAASPIQNVGTAQVTIADFAGATAPANAAGCVTFTVYDYRGTSFNKTVTAVSGNTKANSTGNIIASFGYGEWKNTAAITSIKVFLSAGNFVDNSIVSLYGLS